MCLVLAAFTGLQYHVFVSELSRALLLFVNIPSTVFVKSVGVPRLNPVNWSVLNRPS